MRIRLFRQCRPASRGAACGTLSILAIAGFGLAAGHAEAQQADFPPVQQVAAVSAPQQSGPSPIEELQRRLDEQAQEIQQLQTQLNGGIRR